VSGFELVAGIIAAFFVIGIGVGVVVMIALSALRYRRAVRGDDYNRDGRRGPLRPGDGGESGDGPPRWPDR
jgi:hypothetical protein